jgi:hypothetical protein
MKYPGFGSTAPGTRAKQWAQRAGLPAVVAERFSCLYLHTHAMAAVACLPLAVL